MSYRLDAIPANALANALSAHAELRERLEAGDVPLEHCEAAERELDALEREVLALCKHAHITAHYDAGGDLDSLDALG